MPLNKLDNFIKNTDGRIIYVSPSDLDSTDSIDNEGNSLARPFKTVQRALIEAARFSYVKGNGNDITEKTTILLMPGEHIIDNRPGFTIYNNSGSKVNSATGEISNQPASDHLPLSLTSNFDLTQENNDLIKFNSTFGGVIVPRGTSIVGLDLRKTKIRPLYVPNPTYDEKKVPYSAIFRITGACYLWQFSVFDGDEFGLVYTQPNDFSLQSTPTFSHHKLSVFEYADGVNKITDTELTDLEMYYAKLSIAFGGSTSRNIDQKYPTDSDGFAPRRPEFEIVGAFAADPLKITDIISGDGTTPTRVITATTEVPHQLNQGTPIRITGVSDSKYNISTKVQSVDPNNNLKFTYIIESNPASVDPDPTISGAEKVIVETDTVSGASPYIFNISMRSVWGMNGMHTDGSKATGFRSMVVAQFTGVSLQKDDRAFVKYNPSTRNYSDNITINEVTGSDLSAGSSSSGTVYHLDSGAIYRKDWNSTHIRMSNDAILQIVSVFAIGYNKHFSAETGSDASITNSNSNFGQLALTSSGFKKDAFRKDDKVFISHVIGPRTVESSEETIDWIGIANTTSNSDTRLYLDGFENPKVKPPILTQGFRIGAKVNDKLFLKLGTNDEKFANIVMSDGASSSSFKEAIISSVNSGSNNFSTSTAHGFESGQKVIIISDNGDYPENIKSNTVYFIIKTGNQSFKLAPSKAEADDDSPINVAGGANLRAISRVSDMNSGDVGHPVQFDSSAGVNRWYINATSVGSDGIFDNLNALYNGDATEPSFVKRKIDARSLDEKIYKFRLVVPKEFTEAKNPESAFIIQESSTTGFIEDADATKSSITISDYDFNRNPRFISTCSYNSVDKKVTVLCEKPHNLNVNDVVIIRNVKDSTITGVGTFNRGYNGTFTVSDVDEDALTFKYKYEKTPTPGSFTNDTTTRDRFLPRFERNDLQTNAYLYRNELISEYDESNTHGVYHSFVLNSNNHVTEEFTDTSYSQKVTDFYPQLDRDNVDDNPLSARSFALRSPLGEVETSDLKKSLTKETADLLLTSLGVEKTITNVNASGVGNTAVTITFDRNHNFTGITTYTTLTNGANYTDGTYQNVKLLNSSQSGTWKGATANVFVSGGGVSTVEIVNTGSNYDGVTELFFDANRVGAGNGAARVNLNDSCLTKGLGQTIQFTGDGVTADIYCRITEVNGTKKIEVIKASNDPAITTNHKAFLVGPTVQIQNKNFADGKIQLNTLSPHDLEVGNKFTLIDNSNQNVGTFTVSDRVDVDTFKFVSSTNISNIGDGYILKHGLSSNNAVSDKSEENLQVRATTLYDNDFLTLTSSTTITDDKIKVSHSGTGILNRFPIGTYVQIDDEILRISANTLSGTGNDELSVIRGVLATSPATHLNGSVVKKIRVPSIELRRPSILRASGHTFEYLGYGPGNYSTALPQVQDITITEEEEFLTQSQEQSAGVVVYSGMNNRGDFFIGNQKKSSSTGEEITFDTPIPTVTGEDPSRFSVVFDEVTVKERIVVEGGDSKLVLSQFDGPVNFDGDILLGTDSKLRLKNTATSTSDSTGALVVAGGVGVGGDLNVGGNIIGDTSTNISGINSVTATKFVGPLEGNADTATTATNSINSGISTNDQNAEKNIVFVGANAVDGDNKPLQIDSDKTLTFNPSTNKLTCPTFVGNLTGNADTATSATTASTATNSNNSKIAYNGNDSQKNITFVDAGTSDNDYKTLQIDSDKTLTFNPSNDTLTTKHVDVKGELNFTGFSSGGKYIDFVTKKDNDTSSAHLRLANDAQSSGGFQNAIQMTYDGSVKLYHSGTEKFRTQSTGCKVFGELKVEEDIVAFTGSDKRLKDNINPIADAINKVKSISGNTFEWNEKSNHQGQDTGVIAQEIEALGLPGTVETRSNGYKAVKYERLVPLLIEAIKELSDKVDVLEQKLSDK